MKGRKPGLDAMKRKRKEERRRRREERRKENEPCWEQS